MGIKQSFDYDVTNGNQTGAATVDNLTNPTMLIKTKTEYTADGNYPLKSYDARGNVVTKEMDTDGTLKSVTDPEGQKVEYGYDPSKRVELVKTEVTENGVKKVYKNEYTYQNDRLETVKHNTTDNNNCDVVYTFGYDDLGRKTTVKVGNQTLSTNVYSNDRNGILKEVQYGNGGKVSYEHDDFDRITGVKYDGESSPRYTYEYGANGQAAFMKDNNLNRIHQTEYDLAERPVQSTIRDTSDNLIYRTTLTYDGKNRLETFTESLPEESHKSSYAYDKDNRTTEIQYDDANHKVNYTYDTLGRINERKVTNDSNVYTSSYQFVQGDENLYGTGATTPLVKKITQNGIGFEYTYDERGNIVSEKRGSLTTTYAYDALGQLIRVNDPDENKTWVYEYDLGGNMTKRTQYAYTADALGSPVDTRSYSYDTLWKDQLISNGSYPLTYDSIGNLKTYGGWEYEWKAGRQLVKQTQDDKIVSYDYDCNGMRIRQTISNKTSGAVYATYNYTYSGDKLVHLTVYNDSLHFFYDNLGRPANVMYNGVMYTYLHNLQGDIVGIVDSSGTLVVEYKYNAWGTILSKSGIMANTLGHRNPFRYRSYIYDEETWMYWLKSRYYYPELHRFISPDCFVAVQNDLFGLNTYAYCNNAPVCCCDADGNIPQVVIDKHIHDKVLDYICRNNEELSWKNTCVYYNGKNFLGGRGFCDLYNINTGEVWELKKRSESKSCQTSVALRQLQRYVDGKLKVNLDQNLHFPYITPINSESFTYEWLGYEFDVSYCSEGNGILRYHYDKRKTETREAVEKTLAAVITIGVAGAVGYFCGGGMGVAVAVRMRL